MAFETVPVYHDIDDYPVRIGSMVAITEQFWTMLPEEEQGDLYGRTYQVIGIDDESGDLGLAEVTDTSGTWEDWRPNLAIPVLWEWNYRKYAAI
jgi:hypothetical protein